MRLLSVQDAVPMRMSDIFSDTISAQPSCASLKARCATSLSSRAGASAPVAPNDEPGGRDRAARIVQRAQLQLLNGSDHAPFTKLHLPRSRADRTGNSIAGVPMCAFS